MTRVGMLSFRVKNCWFFWLFDNFQFYGSGHSGALFEIYATFVNPGILQSHTGDDHLCWFHRVSKKCFGTEIGILGPMFGFSVSIIKTVNGLRIGIFVP